MTANKIARAVLYTRVSTEEQAKSGTSLSDQHATCRAKAQELGAMVVSVYEDAGVSGGLYWERDGLQRALADLESGKANMLIIATMSRLSRERSHYNTIKGRISIAGARLVYCDAEYEDSAMGEFAEHISSDFTHLERRVIRERFAKGRRRAALDKGTQPQVTFKPFGYYIPTHDDVLLGNYAPDQRGKYQVVESEARWVREIFQRVANGESLHSVARWLNEQGVATPRRALYWRVPTLKRILNNPVYKGMAIFGRHERRHDYSLLSKEYSHGQTYTQPYVVRETSPDKWIYLKAPALVDEATWLSCQARIQENREKLSGRSDRRYMLTGLMRCPKCNRTMTATKRMKKRTPAQVAAGSGTNPYPDYRYACRDSRPSRNTGGVQCEAHNYNGNKAERAVLAALQHAIQHPQAIADALQVFRAAQSQEFDAAALQRLKTELAALQRRETATIQAQISGIECGANVSVYENALRETGLKRTQIENAIGELEAQQTQGKTGQEMDEAQLVAEALGAVEEVLSATSDKITDSEKNGLLSQVVQSIYPSEGDTYAIQLKPFVQDDLTVNNVRTLWPPDAATSSARLTVSCPLTSDQSTSVRGSSRTSGGSA